jgi:hypothetical protein
MTGGTTNVDAPVQKEQPNQPGNGAMPTPPPATKPANDWKMEEIRKLKERGLILNNHDPDEIVTFAVMATIINRLWEKK